MKGPYQRLKIDLRRVWECPACQRRERTAGTVTFRHCTCRIKQIDGKPVVMKLVEDGAQRRAVIPAQNVLSVATDTPLAETPPGDLPSANPSAATDITSL